MIGDWLYVGFVILCMWIVYDIDKGDTSTLKRWNDEYEARKKDR